MRFWGILIHIRGVYYIVIGIAWTLKYHKFSFPFSNVSSGVSYCQLPNRITIKYPRHEYLAQEHTKSHPYNLLFLVFLHRKNNRFQQ